MKKMVVSVLSMALLTVVSSISLLTSYAEVFEGKELFTRSNLKTNGSIIYFHNMSLSKGFIPAGTAVVITKVGKRFIKFEDLETGEKYTIKEPSAYYSKYFVESIKEVGLKKMDEKTRENIKNMSAVQGMTKKEVFTAKGCPAYIGYGEKSEKHSLDQIMDSDTWYYNANSRGREMIVTFENGAVVNVEGRKQKK